MADKVEVAARAMIYFIAMIVAAASAYSTQNPIQLGIGLAVTAIIMAAMEYNKDDEPKKKEDIG
jgi:uncharacterized membrane protein